MCLTGLEPIVVRVRIRIKHVKIRGVIIFYIMNIAKRKKTVIEKNKCK